MGGEAVYQAILFDLDGTLLPLDEKKFIELYFAGLLAKTSKFGLSPAKMVEAVWSGTKAMIDNHPPATNETQFWNAFERMTGIPRQAIEPSFREYYETDFEDVRIAARANPLAKPLITHLRELKTKLILATNPVFPVAATKRRMAWIDLEMADFSHVTTYDNCSYAKPNPGYYRALLEQFHLDPRHCLMVGNDVDEDMIA